MKRIIALTLLTILLLSFAACGKEPATVTLGEAKLPGVTEIKLRTMTDGKEVVLTDSQSIAQITGFLRTVDGINGKEIKGTYNGTYELLLTNEADETVLLITFGSDSTFALNGISYELINITYQGVENVLSPFIAK